MRLPINVSRRSSGSHATGFGGAVGVGDVTVGVGEAPAFGVPSGDAEPPGVGLGDADGFGVAVGFGDAVGLGDAVGWGEGDGLADGVAPSFGVASAFGVASDDGVPLAGGGNAGVGSGVPRARTAATMIAIDTARTPITNARRTQ